MTGRGAKRSSPAERIVVDTEALMAFFYGEKGADVVRRTLADVADGATRGFVNEVNAAEVWYTTKRKTTAEAADDRIAWLVGEARVALVPCEETWQRAARIKADHSLSLGDAFALATALLKACPLLAGDDEEMEAGRHVGVEIQRIRARH